MGLKTKFRNLIRRVGAIAGQSFNESQLLATGRLLSWACRQKRSIASLEDVEFKIFSQFGDDGIIQWLTHHVEIHSKTFIEFGVENYRESNTRFLMMNDNWSGFVMDGLEQNISDLVTSEYFWKYDLTAKFAFIDCDNVNQLISSSCFDRAAGLLHIDLDGNDYWIWQKIDVISPIIVIVEYNSVLGIDRPITVPYDKSFSRMAKHYSGLYWGTSLRALHELAGKKGYSFIGCNSSGNNAYFVRTDMLNDEVRESSLEAGYVVSKYRESRNESGELTYLAGSQRKEAIRGVPVYNVATDSIEAF